MHVVLLLLAIQAQDYSTASLERRAMRTGVLMTVVPFVTGVTVAATSKSDDGGGAVIAAFGLLIGPTFGYQEARMYGRGWGGAGIRTGLMVGTLAGAMAVCGWYCTNDQETGARWILTGGLALVTASTIYDLSRLRHNIRRHEAKRRLSVRPWIESERSGIALNLEF